MYIDDWKRLVNLLEGQSSTQSVSPHQVKILVRGREWGQTCRLFAPKTPYCRDTGL